MNATETKVILGFFLGAAPLAAGLIRGMQTLSLLPLAVGMLGTAIYVVVYRAFLRRTMGGPATTESR
jgi:membrane protein implicated in regulation of membrane protease activity